MKTYFILFAVVMTVLILIIATTSSRKQSGKEAFSNKCGPTSGKCPTGKCCVASGNGTEGECADACYQGLNFLASYSGDAHVGQCGAAFNKTCGEGQCCSLHGWCGTSPDHCTYGQESFNGPKPIPISTNNKCGAASGKCPLGKCCQRNGNSAEGTCSETCFKQHSYMTEYSGAPHAGQCGTGFKKACGQGQCCSKYGWCGNTTEHCNSGQAEYNGVVPGSPSSTAGAPISNSTSMSGNNATVPPPPTTTTTTSTAPTSSQATATTATNTSTPPPTALIAVPPGNTKCGPSSGKCPIGQCCHRDGTNTEGNCSNDCHKRNSFMKEYSGPAHIGQCGTGFEKSCGTGQCCSEHGWCGSTTEHCSNAQSKFHGTLAEPSALYLKKTDRIMKPDLYNISSITGPISSCILACEHDQNCQGFLRTNSGHEDDTGVCKLKRTINPMDNGEVDASANPGPAWVKARVKNHLLV